MQLNDVRYFRLPSLHARKRMMIIRVIPRVADPASSHAVRYSNLNSGFSVGVRSPDCDRRVESKQSSNEIAFTTYDGFETIESDEQKGQDICVETEVIEFSKNLSSLTLRENVPTIAIDDSERSKFPQIEDDCQRSTRGTMYREKLRDHMRRSIKSPDRKQNRGDRMVEVEEDKYSSWWKDGRQTILQFFARILGKRAGMGTKGPTDSALSTGKQDGEVVKRVSRGNESHNKRRRGVVDGGVYLKRVGNGYIANTVYRNGSRRKSVTGSRSREQEYRPSIYVRQIQRTRDRNLRVMLLERELRGHLLDKDNTRVSAKGTVMNVRQLSSPLC